MVDRCKKNGERRDFSTTYEEKRICEKRKETGGTNLTERRLVRDKRVGVTFLLKRRSVHRRQVTAGGEEVVNKAKRLCHKRKSKHEPRISNGRRCSYFL